MDVKTNNFGYNLGLEVTNCYAKYFDHREAELNGLINKLSRTNIDLKIVADTMNKLAHAKSKGKDLDCNQDERLKQFIVYIHRQNPTIFDDKIQGLPANWNTIDDPALTLDGALEQALKDVHLASVNISTLDEKDIDAIIQGLDAETKMRTADLNETMMQINNKYEDRSQMTENSRQVLKEADELNKSILRKIRG